jgi:hypothetical protein
MLGIHLPLKIDEFLKSFLVKDFDNLYLQQYAPNFMWCDSLPMMMISVTQSKWLVNVTIVVLVRRVLPLAREAQECALPSSVVN